MTSLRVVLLSLVVVGVCAAAAPARQILSLDGEWQCAFGELQAQPEAENVWRPIVVPSVVEWQPEGRHCLWYRKQFLAPTQWSGSRIVLRFGGVKFQHRALLNGKEIGAHLGGFEPVEYDVTDRVLFGRTNQLYVAVQDWTALIAKGAKVGKPDGGGMHGSWVESGILAPIGSRGHEMGIWQSVTVEARPPVWIEDVFVVTSVRESRIRVQVEVRNDGVTPASATVTARVAEGGAGPRFAPAAAEVPPGSSESVALDAAWPDARLWSPDDPHLYTLVVGLRSFAMSDVKEVRFGFREFWIDGDRFVLNGVPIHLLATASHPLTDYDEDPSHAYAAAKAAGCVAMRLHAQPWPQQWYDAADEAGMLLIWESALWCLSDNYALSDDEFWENAQRHIASQAKLQRNHPSVVIWSAENELLLCGGDRVQGTEEKLGKLADLIHELDPTRPVMFEGDGDPAHKADVVNLHYPHELGWGQWPETAYWLEAPAPLDNYPRTWWEWDHRKPLYVGEFLWAPPAEADAASVLLGDRTYPDLAFSRLLAKAAAWEWQVIAFRDAGVSGMCPWTLWETGPFPNPGSDAHQRAYQKLAAFTREVSTEVFAGSLVDRTITVHNDTAWKHGLDLRWSLTPQAGGWRVADSTPAALGPGERARFKVSLALPPIDEEMELATYAVELWEGDKLVFSDRQQWKVYGRAPLSGPVPGAPKEVSVYDPRGDTSRLLDSLDVKCLPLPTEGAGRQLHFTPVALIGVDAFQPTGTPVVGLDDSLTGALREFVEGGGTLLVLAQTRYPSSLIPLGLSDHSSTVAFARRPDHPILAGLVDDDLAHWLPDGPVSRKEIVKPATGGFTVIVDSGGPEGLATAGLAELRLGKGRIVLCQLDVVGKYGVSPPATKLLRNILSDAPRRAPAPVLLGAVCDEKTGEELAALGVRYQRIGDPLAHASLDHYGVLLISDLQQIGAAADGLRRFVRQGGRVVLHNVTQMSLPVVAKLIGEEISLRGDASVVRVTGPSGPAAGITNWDLTWLSPPLSPFAFPSHMSHIADNAITPPYREVGPAGRVEAEDMDRSGVNAAPEALDDGQAVGMYGAGELRAGISVPQAGPYLLTLRAKGSPAAGDYPQASIRLDGTALDTIIVDSDDWQTLTALVDLPAGDHQLGVSFDNDFYAPPEDRNLWLDWVSWAPVEMGATRLRLHTMPGVLASIPDGKGMWLVDQVRWEAPDADRAKGRRYLATLLTNLGCGFVYPAGETVAATHMTVEDCEASEAHGETVGLYSNGRVETEVEFAHGGEYLFTMLGQGTAVDDVYPHLELRIDGQVVGAADLQGGSWQTLALPAAVQAGKHILAIAFTNDDWKPPQDRNLIVRSLTIAEVR